MELNEEAFVRLAAITDDDLIIQTTKTFLDKYLPGSIERTFKAYKFSTYFNTLYEKKGSLIFLDEAVRLARDALNDLPSDHPSRATLLGNLAAYLGRRYDKSREISDLEEGLQLLHTATAMSTDEHDKSAMLNSLVIMNERLYSRTGSIKYLLESVRIAREVCGIVKSDDPRRVHYLNSLASSLQSLYRETKDFKDINDSVTALQEAVKLDPSIGPARLRRLVNLANCLTYQYEQTKTLQDLNEAIIAAQEAVDNALPEDLDLAQYSLTLGNLLRIRHSKIQNEADLQAAIPILQSALDNTISSIKPRIMAGRYLSLCLAEMLDWQGAYKAAIAATRLLPLLAPRSLGTSDAQYALSEFLGLASDAAAITLNAEQSLSTAIEMLELGRSVLVGSLGDIRTDISDLKMQYPELESKFIDLRDQLNAPAALDGSDPRAKALSEQTSSSNRRDADKRLGELLAEIRKKPGFENFQSPLTLDEMYAAADGGTIAFINISFYRCDAFIIHQNSLKSVHLPLLSQPNVEDLLSQYSAEHPVLLAWIWHVVANPVLETLHYTHPPANNHWPHVWWILTGVSSRLPIHAAGFHERNSSETVLDRVVSSYSSSVKTIVRSRRTQSSTPKRPDKALLIAMKTTPGNSELPHAVKEVEMIHHLCKSTGIESFLPLQRKQDLISHLSVCQIFHFAGHGRVSESNPLQSSLLLRDSSSDQLTVEDLLDLNLQDRSPFLAYLSACGTGQIGEKEYLDESLHLISACQLAGFRHVIGTLWDVNDETSIDMAKIVYEVIKQGQWSDASVSQGLHQASRELRDRWLRFLLLEKASSLESHPTQELAGSEVKNLTPHGISHEKRASRNADLSDEESDSNDEIMEVSAAHIDLLSWVPYVHFGG